MPDTVIRAQDAGGVLTLRLNRPDKKNALTGPMYDALTAALKNAEQDDATRAVLRKHGESPIGE